LQHAPRILFAATSWFAVLALCAPADGQTVIPIDNPGFEAPTIPAGTFNTSAPPTDWVVYGNGIDFGFRTVGVLDPAGTAYYPGGVPEGENVGVAFLLDDPGDQTVFAGIEAGIEQELTNEPLLLGTRYTLTVEVGNIAFDPSTPQFEFAGFPRYRIELLAGGTAIACDDDSLLPPEGGFLTSVMTLEVGASHPQAGMNLGVRLINLNASTGIEVNFDDVRLEAEPFYASFCDDADGSLASCPCSNPGAPDTGCDLQQTTGGVRFDVLAQETSPQNRVTVQGTGYPAASAPAAIVIRAAALDPSSPVVFGDGLRCIGVPLVRLGAAFAAGGTSTHGFGHGAMAGSGAFRYQLWFRNTPAMFCDPLAAFNLSSGRTIVW
jgi:hypothetical protein